ncbi:MAG: hypothetical protein AAF368_10400, partial [Planctomycetota bacterium]
GLERIQYRKLQSEADFNVHGWGVFADGAWMRLAEKRLARTSQVRDKVTPYWALLLCRGLHSGRRNVRIGPEGWLFVEERLEPAKDPEKIVAGWPAAVLAGLSRGIEARGMRFSVVPVPRKEIVHKDKLPRGSDPRTGLMPKFLKMCEDHGVEVVDLMPAFARLKEEPAYYKTDSHWAPGAEFLAARRTAHDLGCLVPADQRLGEFEPGAPVRGGFDLLELLGMPRSMILEAGIKDERRSWTGTHETGSNRGVLTSPKGRLAIAGTSFSARRYYPLFLAHFFGQPIFNGARIGGNPMNPLQEVIARSPAPEHILLEVPGHALFNATPLPTAGDVVPEFSLPGALVVCDKKNIRITPRFKKGEFQVPRRKVLAQVANGPVGHTGDGVLWWRIRGEVKGDHVGVTYMQKDRRLIVPWKKEQRELFIPVCVETSSWSTGALVLHGPHDGPRMRIDSIDLCAFVVEEGAIDFEPGMIRVGPDEKSRMQEFTPVSESIVPRGAILVAKIDPVRKGAQFITVVTPRVTVLSNPSG